MKMFYGICLAVLLVFECGAGRIKDNDQSLAEASWWLDEAHKGGFSQLDRYEKTYNKLVRQNAVTVTWPDEKDRLDQTVLELQQQELKTQQCIMRPPEHIYFFNIQELNISENRLNDLRLGDLLSYLPNLTKLLAARNEISHVSTWGIGRGCQLKVIDLSYNQLPVFDLRSLLKRCRNIKTINLSHNKIEDVLIYRADSKTICLPQNLQIDLFSNRISAERIKMIKQFYQNAIEQQQETTEKCMLVGSGSAGCIGGAICFPNTGIGFCFGSSIAAMISYVLCTDNQEEKLNETIRRLKNIRFDEVDGYSD